MTRKQWNKCWFLYVEGDLTIQLGQITKVYKVGSAQFKQGFNVEVKFKMKTQKEDLHLVESMYDENLTHMKAWVVVNVVK